MTDETDEILTEESEGTAELLDYLKPDDGEKNKTEKGTLYLTATPIGNMADLSARAAKVLTDADFIAAEDSRVTLKILTTLGLHKSVVSYHEHNKREVGPKIVQRLKSGESCALVTDAGTPAISDPGSDLVKLCIESGIRVTSVPGACAAVTALILSGFDTRRFIFEGFLEGTDTEKRERLAELSSEKRTAIFYEAPHRLTDTLKLMNDEFADRRITLCRELTKLNEEIIRTTVSEAYRKYTETPPRGEFVIVLDGKKEAEKPFWAEMTVKEHVAYYMETIGLDKMSATKAAAKDRGVSKNTIYKELL